MAINNTSNVSELVRKAVDQRVDFAFNQDPVFLAAAEPKEYAGTTPAKAGEEVEFTLVDNTNVDTTPLDSDGNNSSKNKGINANTVSLTLNNYGDNIKSNEKLDLTSWASVRGSIIPELLGRNARAHHDRLAREALDAQEGTDYISFTGGHTAKSSLDHTDVVSADQEREVGLALDRENVSKFGLGFYYRIMHPDQLNDLKTEVGDNSFMNIAKYARPEEALTGEIGAFDQFRYIKSTDVKVDYSAGSEVMSTTATGVQAAGTKSLVVGSTTSMVANTHLSVVDTDDNVWTYKVKSITDATTVVIGKVFNKNGNKYSSLTEGLVKATEGGEAVYVKNPVYTSYALGFQSLGYGYAYKPKMDQTGPFDDYGLVINKIWKSLDGIGALRDASCHKLFGGAAQAEVA